MNSRLRRLKTTNGESRKEFSIDFFSKQSIFKKVRKCFNFLKTKLQGGIHVQT